MDISIGMQSLMHPIDWLELNNQAGVQQPPAWTADIGREDEWFDGAEVSILRTPLDRKTGGFHQNGVGDEEDDISSEDGSAHAVHESPKSVRHEIQTVFTFPLHDAVQLSSVLDLIFRMQSQPSDIRLTPEVPLDMRSEPRLTPRYEKEMDMPPPFSSIKRGVSGKGVPLGKLNKDRRAKSKRNLFEVRASLDDDDDNDDDDENVNRDNNCEDDSEEGNDDDDILIDRENVSPN